MLGMQFNHNIIPADYHVFGGLDVDKKHIVATFMDHQQAAKSTHMPYDADHLIHFVQKHFPNQKIAFAYEAGPTGYGLYDQLTKSGYPCLVAAPSMIPIAPGQRVKTNRLDSKRIAEMLRGGHLRSIHVPTPPYRQLRHLVQLRDTFVKQAVAHKCRIKALFLMEGLQFPSSRAPWTKSVLSQLAELPCDPTIRFKLDSLLAGLSFAQQQVLQTQKEIRRYCQHDPELSQCIQHLTTIPGIGRIVASHLLARIGDWRLIDNVRQLSSFLGLIPRENSTGDRIHRGSITHSGDGRLRTKLVQSAWISIYKDPEMTEFYNRIRQRHPVDQAARKAIVAVANKLTKRIYSVLKQQRPYVVR